MRNTGFMLLSGLAPRAEVMTPRYDPAAGSYPDFCERTVPTHTYCRWLALLVVKRLSFSHYSTLGA